MYRNDMYDYLKEHSYISKNKKSNYQFELSKERAECIANKYNNLVEEKIKVALSSHKYATECEDKIIVLQSNWKELKNGLKSLFDFDKDVVGKDYLECAKDVLSKMQELEDNNDKN